VLAYPKFQLAQGDREELLATYLPHTEVVQIQAVLEEIPKCSDKDDQMFLQLAFAGKADLIVTGDKGLLQMRDECPFSILTPTEARKELFSRMTFFMIFPPPALLPRSGRCSHRPMAATTAHIHGPSIPNSEFRTPNSQEAHIHGPSIPNSEFRTPNTLPPPSLGLCNQIGLCM
jgi:hypothetical protein